MVRLGFLALLLMLSGCELNNENQTSGVDLSQAIQVGEDLFYIPINQDADNCTMYRTYAKLSATVSVILYQNGAGKFSTFKDKKTCL
jgi:hypothetical protein